MKNSFLKFLFVYGSFITSGQFVRAPFRLSQDKLKLSRKFDRFKIDSHIQFTQYLFHTNDPNWCIYFQHITKDVIIMDTDQRYLLTFL